MASDSDNNNTIITTPFFDAWITRQETFLEHLEGLISPIDGFDRDYECSIMIPRVISHYRQFEVEKMRAAAGDVFVLISPPWLSSYERSLLWVAGFRPSMLFPIVERSVAGELTGEQRERIGELRAEARRREREISSAMARAQEMAAEKPVYGVMRKVGRGEEVAEVGRAVEGVRVAMEAAVESADELRGRMAVGVAGVLSPVQCVRFMAAVARFQLQARKWGVERDRRREAAAAAGEL